MSVKGSLFWNQAGGCALRTAWFNGSIHAGKFDRLECRGGVQAAVVCDRAGRLYTADMGGWIVCRDTSGCVLWELKLESGVAAAPAFYEEKALLYIGTLRGNLYAIDTPTASIRWHYQLPTEADPRITGDVLLIVSEDHPYVVACSWGGRFWMIDGVSGEPVDRWDGGYLPSAGAAADEYGTIWFSRAMPQAGIELVCRTLNGELYTVRSYPDGPYRRRWTVPGPLIDPAGRYVVCIANGVRSSRIEWIDLRTQQPLRSVELDATVCAPPALGPQDLLAVPDMRGRIMIFTLGEGNDRVVETGEEYFLCGGLWDSDGFFWCASPTGRVYRVNGADGGLHTVALLPRAVIGRLSVDPSGALLVPCMDHSVYKSKD